MTPRQRLKHYVNSAGQFCPDKFYEFVGVSPKAPLSGDDTKLLHDLLGAYLEWAADGNPPIVEWCDGPTPKQHLLKPLPLPDGSSPRPYENLNTHE